MPRLSRKPDYKALERKVFAKIVFITFSAVLIVFLLASAARGYAGDFIVRILRVIFGMRLDDALRLYNQIVRNNIEFILCVAVAGLFILLSRALLSQFGRYFNEISDGLDALADNEDGVIKLSPEMATMERKLVAIKRALDERQRDAKAAEQRKNELVMYLAHDIRTPLTTVIGYLSLICEAPETPLDKKAKYANIALDKAYSLEKLIDEFFEITRYDFRLKSLSRERVDLCVLLSQMTEEFFPVLSERGKRIESRVPENITVYGDPDMLARVFNNVLKNAAAYSPDDSVIDISASVGEGRARVVFTNDGRVPEDKLDTIFEKFYRLDNARSSEGGAGLGLAIAKEIITAHDGRIFAESDGIKTSFIVELPEA